MSETLQVEFEPRAIQKELIDEPEFEPSEIACENKLGFTALCASCPLIAQFGGCPKDIRENFANAQSPQDNILDGNVYINTADSFGFNLNTLEGAGFMTPASILKATIVENTEPSTKVSDTKKEVSAASKPPAVNEQPIELKPIQVQKNEQKPHRSYLDLLFDDTVAVVVAPQLMPKKKPAINRSVTPPSVVVPEMPTVTIEKVTVQSPTSTVEVKSVEVPSVSADNIITSEPVLVDVIVPTPMEANEPTVVNDEQITINEVVKVSRPIIVEDIITEEPPLYDVSTVLAPALEAQPPEKKKIALAEKVPVVKESIPEVVSKKPPFTENSQLEEVVVQEIVISEKNDTITEEVVFEKEQRFESSSEDNRMSITETPDTAVVAVDPAESTEINDTLLEYTPAASIISTPETLLEPVYPPKRRQPGESNLMLGVIALLKLVFIRLPSQ